MRPCAPGCCTIVEGIRGRLTGCVCSRRPVTPFSPRALDQGLPAVTVALTRLRIPALTGMLAARHVENHGEETAALARAVGDRVVGEDNPRSTFHAETLPRRIWDPERDPLLAPVDKVVLVHRLCEVISLLGCSRFPSLRTVTSDIQSVRPRTRGKRQCSSRSR